MKKAKTSRKTTTSSKAGGPTSAKTSSKKAAGEKRTSKLSAFKRSSKKFVDKVLVKVSPQLQSKIDHLIQTLESSREGQLGDLSLLAGKILVRAQEVSRSLRGVKKKKSE